MPDYALKKTPGQKHNGDALRSIKMLINQNKAGSLKIENIASVVKR